MWQAEVVGLAGAHAPRHARTLLRLFRRLGLRVALSAFDVLQVEVEVPGLKPRVLEADAVAEAGEEGAGGVLLSSVAVPFPARGRGYLTQRTIAGFPRQCRWPRRSGRGTGP